MEVAETQEIEAKAYDLTTIRPSKSGRVYLFQKSDAEMPVDGKIFLLREGETPVMAFRVLKTYPQSMRIAAKKLLPYEGFAALDRGSKYRAFEKVGDKVTPVPPSPEDLNDIQELESAPAEEVPAAPPEETPPAPAEETPPPPEDLTETPPPEPPAEEAPPAEPTPEASPAPAPEPPGDENVEMKDTDDEEEADEIGIYYPNFITMSVGLINNANVIGPNPKLGGSLAYSRNFGSEWAGEFGLSYYKSGNTDTGVTMTAMMFTGTVRYLHRFTDMWTAYAYAGGASTYISSQIGATKDQLAKAQFPIPAFGVGVFLQTGPNWYLRGNLGYDSVGLGISLRF